jgi:hypothetical protein
VLRRSFCAVIERNARFAGAFETEPYEAAWASEARWFIETLEMQGEDTGLRLYAQISPDGLHWCDMGTEPLIVTASGLQSLALRDFGHWLRLRGQLWGRAAEVKLTITLALKE